MRSRSPGVLWPKQEDRAGESVESWSAGRAGVNPGEEEASSRRAAQREASRAATEAVRTRLAESERAERVADVARSPGTIPFAAESRRLELSAEERMEAERSAAEGRFLRQVEAELRKQIAVGDFFG